MRRTMAALGVVVALGAMDGLAWRIGVAQLDRGADRWIAQARAHGWDVATGERRRSGWPFAATLEIDDVHLAGGARLLPGGLAWATPHLTLRVALAHPATLAVEAGGTQHLRLSHAPEIVLNAATLDARIGLLLQPAGGLVQARDVTAGLLGSGHPADVRVGSLSLAVADAGEAGPAWQAARLDFTSLGVGLPDIGRWPLGGFVASFGGTVGLTSIPGEKADTGSTPENQARAWRDAGGRLELSGVSLHWGPLLLSAAATLGLDDRLQPFGNGSVDLEGSAAALDALAAGGVIAPGLAATVQALLAVMPATPGRHGVRLRFEIRDSTLSVGRIPVVRLHDVSWRKPN